MNELWNWFDGKSLVKNAHEYEIHRKCTKNSPEFELKSASKSMSWNLIKLMRAQVQFHNSLNMFEVKLCLGWILVSKVFHKWESTGWNGWNKEYFQKKNREKGLLQLTFSTWVEWNRFVCEWSEHFWESLKTMKLYIFGASLWSDENLFFSFLSFCWFLACSVSLA